MVDCQRGGRRQCRRLRRPWNVAAVIQIIVACIAGHAALNACSARSAVDAWVCWRSAPLQLARPRHVRQAAATAVGAEPAKKYALLVTPTDHYVWRDEAAFVGIVADAGEWTVDVDRVKQVFAEAREKGSVVVFSGAPLYVVKDYVKELSSYGLKAEALQLEVGEEEEKASWSRRDWKELSPESKEAAEGREVDGITGKMQVFVKKTDHPVFDGARGSDAKFKAYVEMASDAAKRFSPGEGEVNACFAKIMGPEGRAPVLSNLSEESAQAAAAQLVKAGFEVEVEAVAGSQSE